MNVTLVDVLQGALAGAASQLRAQGIPAVGAELNAATVGRALAAELRRRVPQLRSRAMRGWLAEVLTSGAKELTR